MGNFCKTIRSWRFCKCPTPYPGDFAAEPSSAAARRSPVDQLGFRFKCCWCIPLKPAAIIIAVLMLIWSFFQLITAEKTIASLFPDKDGGLFYYTKMLYLLCVMGFMFACCILFLGIFLSHYRLVHIFIWYAFVYNAAHAVLTIASFGAHTMRAGNATGRQAVKLVFGISWNCLVFYFLLIVNSYKMLIWMPV